jgi:anthranilate phosphoribosyltransferase
VAAESDRSALQTALAALIAGARPDDGLFEAALGEVLDAEATPAQTGALLAALAVRGETAGEIAAGARAMRSRMIPCHLSGPLVDVCGTGGDGAQTLNVSTAVAFVVAACGLRVAKHGNRAMSSRSGGADVLEALGAKLDLPDGAHASVMEKAGVAFLFAQAHHPALRHIAGVRRELGVRTLFNLLGPLANPAGAQRQLLGVFHPRFVEPVAQALAALGAAGAWVVHGAGGLDELSPEGPTSVIAVNGGGLRAFTVTPEDAGLAPAPLAGLRGGTAQDNAAALRALLDGAAGPYRTAVLLNAAAALCVAEAAADLAAGARLAADAIDSGAARDRLARFVAATQAAR